MKYLYAFDLSMSCTGIAIFDLDTYKPVHISSIKTNNKDTYGVRLHVIREYIKGLIKQYPPYEVAIERGFSRFNNSTQVTYRVHGVINELLKDYEQCYYPPKDVKATILNGNASKKQVQEKIKKLYPEIKFNNEDESDAFAVGLTHLKKKYELKL